MSSSQERRNSSQEPEISRPPAKKIKSSRHTLVPGSNGTLQNAYVPGSVMNWLDQDTSLLPNQDGWGMDEIGEPYREILQESSGIIMPSCSSPRLLGLASLDISPDQNSLPSPAEETQEASPALDLELEPSWNFSASPIASPKSIHGYSSKETSVLDLRMEPGEVDPGPFPGYAMSFSSSPSITSDSPSEHLQSKKYVMSFSSSPSITSDSRSEQLRSNKCGLFSLPMEVRELIYIAVLNFGTAKVRGKSIGPWYKRMEVKEWGPSERVGRNATAILRVNRQAYLDASMMFYSLNTFSFTDYFIDGDNIVVGNPDPFDKFMRHIPPRHLSFIKRVEFDVIPERISVRLENIGWDKTKKFPMEQRKIPSEGEAMVIGISDKISEKLRCLVHVDIFAVHSRLPGLEEDHYHTDSVVQAIRKLTSMPSMRRLHLGRRGAGEEFDQALETIWEDLEDLEGEMVLEMQPGTADSEDRPISMTWTKIQDNVARP